MNKSQEEEDDWFKDDGDCESCGGRGYVVICIDDLCQGARECMHGDGVIACPTCHGEGCI